MFVSSYSTFVGTDTQNKINNYKSESSKKESDSFKSELLKSSVIEPYTNKNLPIDYISNYKSLNNHQKLLEQEKSQDETKLKKLSLLNNAKNAYDENSKIFPLTKKPSLTLSQIPKIDKKEPKDIQEAKEKNLRHVMVNTYLSNDRYYQITAA